MRTSSEPSRDHVEVVRAEEDLVIGRVRVPTERVRVRKVIETEQVTMTVNVRREVLVVERERIAGADPVAGPPVDEPPLEIVLHVEEPVVSTRVVPAERVRVVKHRVAEQRQIVDELRKEQVVFEDERGRPLEQRASGAS